MHLNLPLREPLAPVREDLDAVSWQGRPDGRPWVEAKPGTRAPTEADADAIAERIAATPRGAIVCGAGAGDHAEAVAALAERTGWPILAEPTSCLRCGLHDRSRVIAHYDPLLRSEGFAARSGADLVLRIGDVPTSKALRAWLAASRQIVVDPHAAWQEPTRLADTLVHADPGATVRALVSALERRASTTDGAWLDSWRGADDVVAQVLADDDSPDSLEALACHALARALPDGATVWIGSSMPIRDVESFLPASETQVRFLANRGANGIDGVIASAAGAALATGSPTWVLIGEISLVHDVGGLIAASRAGADLRILCVNNGGGGIFDFLPVAAHAEPALYERHVATPSEVGLAAVAAAAGMEHRLAASLEEIAAAVEAPGLVEVRTDRAVNVDAHRVLLDRISAALERIFAL